MQSLDSIKDRWGTIRQFIVDRYAPWTKDAYEMRSKELEEAQHKLGLVFPQLFKDWHLLSKGPGLDIPRTFPGLEGYVIIAHEAQWAVVWGIRIADLALADPPVILDETFADANGGQQAHHWIEENAMLSEFMVQMGLFTTMVDSDYCGGVSVTAEKAEQIENQFPLLGFPDWHWPKYPTRFFGAEDAYLAITNKDWVWLSAASEEALERVIDLIGVDLDIP